MALGHKLDLKRSLEEVYGTFCVQQACVGCPVMDTKAILAMHTAMKSFLRVGESTGCQPCGRGRSEECNTKKVTRKANCRLVIASKM